MRNSQFILTVAGRLGFGGNNRVAAVIAVAGVSCALAVMLLTLSVSDGFRNGIRQKLSGFEADVVVQPPYLYSTGTQTEYFSATPEVLKDVSATMGQANVATVLRQPGMLKTDNDYEALVFTAYGSGHDFSFQRDNLTGGIMPAYDKGAGGDSIVISNHTASKLGLKTGDRVTACFFADGNIKARRYTVAGTFTSGFGDFDKTVCYAALPSLRRVCGLDSLGVSAVEIHGIPDNEVQVRAQNLQQLFVNRAQQLQSDSILVVDNITHTGALYLSWLDLLDTNVVVIFVLMCCVAAFTLISSLFILILNNVPTIGLLRSLGATRRQVRDIFVALSMRLVGLGMIIGNVLALTLIWVQYTWRVIPLAPDMYYLDHVPVSFSWPGFILVNAGTVVVAWLVLVLPARLASTVSPARTLAYE